MVTPGVHCDDERPAPRQVRLLTRREYASTVRDLLGVEVDTASLPVEPRMRGFDNNAAAARMFGAAPGAEPADAAMRRRRSVLDLVQADMTRLRARLGGDERTTLETHLESFRELARRVAQPPAAVCDPAAFDRRGYVNNPGDGYPPTCHRPQSFATVGDLQMEIAVMALSCRMTRVATITRSRPGQVPMFV